MYRLREDSELEEIGFYDATRRALVLIEWPERAETALPADRVEVALTETGDPTTRRVTVRGLGDTRAARQAPAGDHQRFSIAPAGVKRNAHYLQGDASQRAYARLEMGTAKAILMDAPRQPDGPAVRDGLPYSRIAHLAEDVRPFVAVGGALHRAGLSAPRSSPPISTLACCCWKTSAMAYSADLARAGAAARQEDLWTAAVDTLVAFAPCGAAVRLPGRRMARRTFSPASTGRSWRSRRSCCPTGTGRTLKGAPIPQQVLAAFSALWSPLIDRLIAEPPGWMLRDYHSPNLLWLPDRAGDQARRRHRFPRRAARPLGARCHVAFAGCPRRRARRTGAAAARSLLRQSSTPGCSVRRGPVPRNLRDLRRLARDATAGVVGPPVAPGRQAAIPAARAAHLGLPRPQSAPSRAEGTAAVVRPAFSAGGAAIRTRDATP